MEQKRNIITKEGLAELKAELKNLVEIERPQVIQDIKDARAQGDLSENAEFDAAREKQGQIEDRIREIENIIENSQVSTNSQKDSNKVRIGSLVQLEYPNHKKVEYRVVGTLEVDPFKNLISNISPLGKAIMGKSVDDKVSFVVESHAKDQKIDVKIIGINNQ